VNKNA